MLEKVIINYVKSIDLIGVGHTRASTGVLRDTGIFGTTCHIVTR